MSFELKKGEEILAKVSATLCGPPEAIGGRLAIGGQLKLTNLRLLFEPSLLSVRKKGIEISLNNIAEVGKMTVGINPCGMFVCTRLGIEYILVVGWGKKKLIQLIQMNMERV
jgi:hypothetical protein